MTGCRYIAGDPRAPGWSWCGRPCRSRSPWCEAHHIVCHQHPIDHEAQDMNDRDEDHSKYGKGAFAGLPRAHQRTPVEQTRAHREQVRAFLQSTIPHSLSAVAEITAKLLALNEVQRLSPQARDAALRDFAEQLADAGTALERWVDKKTVKP
jgi:hypothetical protein